MPNDSWREFEPSGAKPQPIETVWQCVDRFQPGRLTEALLEHEEIPGNEVLEIIRVDV
jgi:hypothetical protein